ncbi:MAG: ABC transporter ATP-binding protein [Gammaproteobacteria bacterium]|nr:ABC transporter ATP-binding protein [Gammaproteobacteria bacterium]MCW5582905.1 ABC transporter ATP-binding protein [Gammaproteobacteria bacterium]
MRFIPTEEVVNVPTITINHASLSYSNKCIFSGIHLELTAGRWAGLLGPSGVGKSSLLRMIAGLTTPQEESHGNILTNNEIPINQQIAYMAQTDLLLPWLNVLENVTLSLKLRRHTKYSRAAQIEKAKSLLDKVGLTKAIHLYPQQLSGGMRQRAALVRTLVEDKPVVLMDEPFSALDAITRYKLHELAVELLGNKTVLFITHDPTEALRLAHDIYLMQGQPAVVKIVATPSSSIPRELTDPEVISLQALLFQELTKATGEMT